MLAQDLVLLGATDLRKSKKIVLKAVTTPQLNKDRRFRAHLFMESFFIVFQTYVLRLCFRLSFVLNFS